MSDLSVMAAGRGGEGRGGEGRLGCRGKEMMMKEVSGGGERCGRREMREERDEGGER